MEGLRLGSAQPAAREGNDRQPAREGQIGSLVERGRNASEGVVWAILQQAGVAAAHGRITNGTTTLASFRKAKLKQVSQVKSARSTPRRSGEVGNRHS